jgi:hypothetical protein
VYRDAGRKQNMDSTTFMRRETHRENIRGKRLNCSQPALVEWSIYIIGWFGVLAPRCGLVRRWGQRGWGWGNRG